ncbi:hypothetical protein BJI45_00425 [Limosilactobacillus reuteri]|uniref:Uncharacterized protein n=1 Tax=Limosilactobacillus reuteri TaxID=1598 RepID=A0AB36I4N9_LIMRT|nr:hypothetical protein [Limosilactobacillus reuteri]OJI11713.1 hypothetical protein BJI45_00425 [Limosilactobacillus reuteri]
MKIEQDIEGLIKSDISTKEIVNKLGNSLHSAKDKAIIAVQQLRKLKKNSDKLHEAILNLDLETAQTIEDYCVFDSFTVAERDRLINYCKKLVEDGLKNKYSIRLGNSATGEWQYSIISKEPHTYGDWFTGNYDHKSFKIPVNAVQLILNEEYIPFFLHSI